MTGPMFGASIGPRLNTPNLLPLSEASVMSAITPAPGRCPPHKVSPPPPSYTPTPSGLTKSNHRRTPRSLDTPQQQQQPVRRRRRECQPDAAQREDEQTREERLPPPEAVRHRAPQHRRHALQREVHRHGPVESWEKAAQGAQGQRCDRRVVFNGPGGGEKWDGRAGANAEAGAEAELIVGSVRGRRAARGRCSVFERELTGSSCRR